METLTLSPELPEN